MDDIDTNRRHGRLPRGGWSRCAISMPACSTSPITRRARGRPGRDADARLSLRHPFLCRRRAATGRARLSRHRALFARLRADPFSRRATPRSGEQAAVGADLIALMDALTSSARFSRAMTGAAAPPASSPRFGRSAAPAWSRRNGYLIQNIAKAMVPAKPEHEFPLWYQYYFQLERGGPASPPTGARSPILWQQWSPNWQFDDASFERTAARTTIPTMSMS